MAALKRASGTRPDRSSRRPERGQRRAVAHGLHAGALPGPLLVIAARLGKTNTLAIGFRT